MWNVNPDIYCEHEPDRNKAFMQAGLKVFEAKKDVLHEKLAFLGFPEARMQAEIKLSGYFDQREKNEEAEELNLLRSLF